MQYLTNLWHYRKIDRNAIKSIVLRYKIGCYFFVSGNFFKSPKKGADLIYKPYVLLYRQIVHVEKYVAFAIWLWLFAYVHLSVRVYVNFAVPIASLILAYVF